MAEVDTPEEALVYGPDAPVVEEDEVSNVLDVEYVNGIPCYNTNHKIKGMEIFERIGWDDRVGGTYLAVAGDKELVLRVDWNAKGIVAMESVFLKKIELRNLWPFFAQLHSAWNMDGLTYLATYFRPGPTLRDCLNFSRGRFSIGTAARLGGDILNCLRHLHGLGYVARCLIPELFHLDAASRHLFMADISNIRIDPTTFNVPATTWTGGSLYAPMSVHDSKNGLARGDELQAWFYLLIHFVKGDLPWDNVRDEQVADIKRALQSTLLVGLDGDTWKQIEEKVNSAVGVQVPEDEVYVQIGDLLKKLAEEAGVESEDENYDFEREANEEELAEIPR